MAAQAAQQKEDQAGMEMSLTQQTPESLLLQATNLQLCQGASSLYGLVSHSPSPAHLHAAVKRSNQSMKGASTLC